MFTNRQCSFQNSCVIDTELSDFHKMAVTILRSYFLKAEPKIGMYRDYKKNSNNEFRWIINTKKAHSAQRNLCVSLVRKAKLDYYNKLNHKKVSDNKTFWKTVKPFFTDKGVNHNRILLVEENETISDNDEISEKLNNFFADIVKNLNIPQYEDHLVSTDNIDDPILRAKEKFKNHQGIQLIKYHYENKNNTFCLSHITHTEIEKELNKLDFSKSSPNSDIPTKIVRIILTSSHLFCTKYSINH